MPNKYTLPADEDTADENLKINDNIIEYLKNEVKDIPLKTKITIAIEASHALSLDRLESLIKSALIHKMLHINIRLKKTNLHSLILALTGVVLVTVTHLLFNGTFTLHELFIVAGGVFIWRSIETLFFDRLELLSEKTNLLKIYNGSYLIYHPRQSHNGS